MTLLYKPISSKSILRHLTNVLLRDMFISLEKEFKPVAEEGFGEEYLEDSLILSMVAIANLLAIRFIILLLSFKFCIPFFM